MISPKYDDLLLQDIPSSKQQPIIQQPLDDYTICLQTHFNFLTATLVPDFINAMALKKGELKPHNLMTLWSCQLCYMVIDSSQKRGG